MSKLFIEDLPPLAGKKVLMRVDFNVPLDTEHHVSDASKIKEVIPSIEYVLKQGGSVILMSHLGRPHNAPNPDFSLVPCAKVLSQILKRPVQMAPDCIGFAASSLASKLQPGEVLLLENLRFHRAEEHPEEGTEFARELASYGDFYVNDAFGTSHRNHSSICTITQFFPGKAAAGYLLQKEIHFLGDMICTPKTPFCALIGGAKISTKMGILESLLKKVQTLLIGGGMAYTFLRAQGKKIGKSIVEEELCPMALDILDKAKKLEVQLLLPVDFKVAKQLSEDAPWEIVSTDAGIPSDMQGFDIGPKTVALFSEPIKKAATILWNGPLGVYEFEPFADGTDAIARVIANTKSLSIVGGGDSLAAINKLCLADKFTHLSTGGGATLEYIELGTLPGIDALSDKKEATINSNNVV